MVTREQVAALVGEKIDFGLARPPFDQDTFGYRLPHLVAAPTGHPLLGEKVIMHSPTEARYFHDLVVGAVPITRSRPCTGSARC